MRTVLFLLYAWLLCFSQPCLARDALKVGEKITGNDILVSAKQNFSLGFFPPQGSTGETERYLGIWYYPSEDTAPQTLVWVANRDKPVVDSSGVFQIAEDGNLEVTDTSGERQWFSELEGSSSTNRTVKLMDSGNLVLLDDQLGMTYLWQSFQHPTDTFLPGMKMDTNLELTSWRGANDPGSGNFTFKMAQTRDNRYMILKNQSQLYWESGRNGELNSEAMFDIIVYNLLMNLTVSTNPTSINNSRYEIIGRRNQRPIDYGYTRLLMNSTGELQFLKRDNLLGDWSVHWLAPASFCERYNPCGKFSSCNTKRCKCLPGFNPIPGSPRSVNSGDSLQDEGCARKSASCGEDTTFLTLVMMKMGNPDKQFKAANETECQSECRKTCPECQAYSYAAPINSTRRDLSFSTCWIWTQDLTTLQEEYLDDYSRNISVRVDISDIAPTAKTCRPCGTNIVPYPLSTGPSCGDPRYFKFSCNHSTGQLSFTTPIHAYRVTRIDADSRMFSIQVNSLPNYCNERSRDDETLQIGFPFNVTKGCYEEDEVYVNWQPPSEPICTEPIDCDGWNHSSCKATGVEKRCLCDGNYHWDGVSLSCTKEAISLPNPSSKEPTGTTKGNSKSPLSLILGITLTSMVILACAVIFAYVWRRKITRKQDRESIQRKRGRFFDSERHVKDLIDEEGLEEKDNEGIEVPYFDFETILVATDHFSDSNKLGRGGYGPVYKGKLQGGQDIAVKRLSSVSSQGLQEFKNEVVLIAKLQHRNLVRLRGYCIKGDEKILLYEYMPNKSLDSLLFDPTQSVLLDWQMRFDIILGVARGLLYLHQDSRLRVIHRDLKTSNILLDEEMQPKISDFGLARIVGGKETEANTERVVGTYGYMSPEYALDGLFSTKSDIFSFGVVLLEIISGKKNTGFYQSKQVSSLLGYAWRLWTENKLLDLMDLSLPETCNANQFTRCAHIGLLCVQDEPGDRPTMSNVVTMLDSETAILPTPKQPTFFASRGLSSTASSSKPETNPQFSEVDIENCFSGSS